MKIHELAVSNIKRVRAVTLNLFDGQHAVLGGRNEQGKSSVLDAIHMALAGGEAICDKPIREGAINGEVTLDLGEIIVTRKFTPKGSTLTVKDKDGNTQSSPQTLLDKLIGKLGFDPLAFSQMDAKTQRDTLATLAGLDFEKWKEEFTKLYFNRREANGMVERLTHEIAGRVDQPPYEEISVSALITELKAAEKTNAAKKDAEGTAFYLERAVTNARNAVENQKGEIARLEASLSSAKQFLGQYESVLSAAVRDHDVATRAAANLPTVDTAPITLRIVEADAINAKVRANVVIKATREKLHEASMLAGRLDARIAAHNAEKQRQVEQAKYPLPGLGITDDCVLINGIPLKQASSEQQIKIGAAISAALNPELRVMIVRGGAFLDENNLVELLKWGTENGIQLFVERVGDGKECSVIIEDGAVLEDRITQVNQ